MKSELFNKTILLVFILIINFFLGCKEEQKYSEKSLAKAKPNIIFIVADDLNDAVTPYGGHPQVVTPNISKMAEVGIMFVNAYANSPICGPSRASFLSGLHAKTTGYFGYNFVEDHWNNNPILSNSPTFVEYFREKGYKTLGTGKIQHNHQEDWTIWDEFGIPPDWGPWPWDGTKKGIMEFGTPSEWRNSVVHPSMPDNFSIDDQFGSLEDVPYVKANFTSGINGYNGWRLNFKSFKYNNKKDRDLMPDELNAQWAMEKLKEEHKKPFLMCIGINRPHSPMFAPDEFFDLYGMDTLQLATIKEGDREDCAQSLFMDSSTGIYGTEKYKKVITAGGIPLLKKWTQTYLANVSFVDAQIGKIVEALNDSDYKNNTYIVLTSDHGYHMGEKNLLFKNTLWDKAAKVPFIVLGPDVIAGKKVDHPISLIDLFPTFLDLCGLPKDSLQLDGYSLKSFITKMNDQKWEGKDYALIALASNDSLGKGVPGKKERQHYSIVTERYKYIRANNGEEELYDHYSDPFEWDNIISEKSADSIKLQMRKKLDYEIY